MNESTKTKIRDHALSVYGQDKQLIQAIQEMSELTKELTKYLIAGFANDNLEAITDEIADVENMMDQLKDNIFSNREAVEKQKIFKLRRLAERIKFWQNKPAQQS